MLLLKLDISKAFDIVSWPFLLEVLQARGFGEKWWRWIEALLSTASSRVLHHLRGVRQGDSLSPMLFIIAMDVLQRLFLKAANDGVLRRMEPPEIQFQCSMYSMMSYSSSGQLVRRHERSSKSLPSLVRRQG